MDHETSVKTLAAEKYLLGELSSPEREGFEQHFFECPECAENVRLGFQFSENAKIVFREERVRPVAESAWWSNLRSWFTSIQPRMLVPVGACLAIAAFSSYQNAVQIPDLRGRIGQLERPQVLYAALLAPSARSTPPSIAVPSGAQFVPLSLATAAIAPAAHYQCELRAASGKSVMTLPVPALDPDANLNLLIPTSSLSSGDYEAILSGVTGGTVTPLEHYRFSLSRK
jgi:anti-sigma factor RsiW